MSSFLEPFSPAGGDAPSPDDEEERQATKFFVEVGAIAHTCSVEAVADDRYRLTLTTDSAYPLPKGEGWSVSAHLMTLPGQLRKVDDGPVSVVFEDVATIAISAYVVVSLTSPTRVTRSKIVLARLVGDPPDRLDRVLAHQLDDPEKFMRYMLLVLSFADPSLLASLPGTLPRGEGDGAWLDSISSQVLELVLRNLRTHAEALRDLSAVIARLTDTGTAGVVPEEIRRLWPAVEDALDRLGH